MHIAINSNLLLKPIQIPGIVLFNKLDDVPKSDTFFFSNTRDCSYLSNAMYGIVRYYQLSITNWLAFLQDQYVNADGIFKQVWQLNNSDCGKYFSKNNNSSDYIQSKILQNPSDIEKIKNKLQDDTLIYLANAKPIHDRMRLWYIDSKCVASSRFPDDISNIFKKTTEDYIEYGNKCAEIYEPDDMYTIDIGLFNNKLYVLNYHCFSTSEFFYSDINQIISSLKQFFQ